MTGDARTASIAARPSDVVVSRPVPVITSSHPSRRARSSSAQGLATVVPDHVRQRHDEHVGGTVAQAAEDAFQVVVGDCGGSGGVGRRRRAVDDLDDVPAMTTGIVVDRAVLGVAAGIHLGTIGIEDDLADESERAHGAERTRRPAPARDRSGDLRTSAHVAATACSCGGCGCP